MKKSLCIDARMVRHSGIGTVIRHLVPFMAREFDTTVILPQSSFDTDFQYVSLNRIAAVSGIYSIKEQVEIPLKVPKCDVLWVPHYNIPVLPTRARRMAVTVHDVFHLDFFKTLSLFKQLYSKGLMQVLARRADVVLTVSNFSKKRLLHHLPIDPTKVRVVYNGIDSEVFLQSGISDKPPFSLQSPYYLWVGNVKPHKNLGLIVKAMAQMAELNLPLPYIAIAGKLEGLLTKESAALEWIEQNPKLKPQFLFLGEVSDSELVALYRNAKALLFPSLYEGFGLPPLEALACGTLPVLSRIEVLEELYHGSAVFVNPVDLKELADFFMRGIEENDREKKLQNGLELVKNQTWEKTAMAYIEAFDQIAAR